MRPGGRPRVSGAGERAGRGAVRSPPLLLGSWLSASALPCALLPPPLPFLDHSQRLGLPRAQGFRAPGAGQRRRPSRAESSWPLGAERAWAEQGVTRSEPLRSIGFTEPGDLREGGGARGGPPGRKRRRRGCNGARRWPPTLPQASRALVSDSGWRVARGGCLETLGRQRLGGGKGDCHWGLGGLWKRWLPLVLKGFPRLQVALLVQKNPLCRSRESPSPDQQDQE